MDQPVLTQATQVFEKFCAFFGALSCVFLFKGKFDAPFKMLCKKAQGIPQKKNTKNLKNLHSGSAPLI